MFLYAHRYFPHNTFCCLHSTSIAFIPGGREVREHICNSTSTLFLATDFAFRS